MSVEDLGLDSLGLVEAIFSIEETFSVNVPFNANDPTASDFDISSVGAIIKAIDKLVMEKSN
jgi:acyl carrier protein